MNESKERFKILKVTVEKKFAIPMHDNIHTKINGWTIEEVIYDWFKQHAMYSHHATRDNYHIGGGDKFIKVEEVDI